MEESNLSLQIRWDNIEPISTEDIPIIFGSLDRQYKRHIDLLKLSVGPCSKKLGVSRIEVGSLWVDFIPWEYATPGAILLMQDLNTVQTFTKGFLVPVLNAIRDGLQLPQHLNKQDLMDLKSIIGANENISENKTLTINQYNNSNITYNNYYSSDQVRQIESGINRQILELENQEEQKEYSDPFEVSGLITAIKWATRKGEIRLRLPGARRAKQYKFVIPASEQMMTELTQRTQISAQAVIIYDSKEHIQSLELTNVQVLET